MKTLKKDNLFLLIPLIILNIISLFNMTNAKLISSVYSNAFIRQLIWFILGYLIIFIIQKIKFKNIFKYSFYLYLFSLFLLVLVLFIGKDVNGAKCWLNILGFSFQPSEIAKFALSLYLVQIINQKKVKTFKEELFMLIKLGIITLIPSILVFLEPDTGAIINFFIILLIVIIALKLHKWWYIVFLSLCLIGGISFGFLYYYYQDLLVKIMGTSLFYRIERLINFASGNSYQLEQALITIGASKMFGVGFNKILLYIPEAPTDFFLAFSIGNYGLCSAFIILLCFLIINIYLMKKISHLKNPKYKTFAFAYLGILIFHQIYNIGMNLGLLPIMGIPLPFLSYGGTNTLINYLFLGLILNFINEKKAF